MNQKLSEFYEAAQLAFEAMRLTNMHGAAHKNCTKECPILQAALVLQKDMADRAAALIPPRPPMSEPKVCRHCGKTDKE